MAEKNTSNKQDYYLASWIEGNLSDIEFKELVSAKDYLIYQKLNVSFNVLSELEAPMDTTFQKIKSKLPAKKIVAPIKTNVIALYTKWAASIAATFLLFFSIYNNFYNTNTSINTGFGEQQTIALLDGSEVILNAKSTLKYNKIDWKNKRELFLDGEAYFKVTKGSTFTVKTKNGAITVLGTQFNVSSKSNYFTVVCYEGKVKVIENNNTHILTPGKGVSIINGNQKLSTIENTQPKWIAGESTFNDVPLEFILNELEHQFNITFDRQNIDQTTNFTGSFDHKNLAIALASVCKPMSILYKIDGNKVLLSK